MWTITQRINQGTFGTVYRVGQRDRIAALKILHPTLTNADRQRIRRSFIAAARVDHPNCVSMIEWLDDIAHQVRNETAESLPEPAVGLVMEFVAGQSIAHFKGAPLSEIIPLLLQTASGLESLHRHHLVHRDLKPENILVDRSGFVKITDFDLAKLEDIQAQTVTGTFIGTVKYASPEQCRQSGSIDARSDLYSLGVIGYELIAGRLPFDGETFTEIALAHLRTPVVSLRRYCPEIPPGLERIILRLLAKSPQDRYASSREVALALQQSLAEIGGASADISPSASPNYLLPPAFCGRQEAIRHLTAKYTAASIGQTQWCFIRGESGIGKTRLVDEFRAGLVQTRVIFLQLQSGQTHDLRGLIEAGYAWLKPFSELERAEILGPLGWLLLDFLPPSALTSRLKPLPMLEGAAAEIRLFSAITDFLLNLTRLREPYADADRPGPLVLILDDLDRASPLFREWLSYLLRNVHQAPLYLLATLREDIDWLPMTSGLMKLDGLSAPATAEMLNSMLGQPDAVHTRLVRELHRQTNGQPRFLQEALQHLIIHQKLTHRDGQWQLQMGAYSEIILPATGHHLLKERLAHLTWELRGVLQQAAMIGQRFEVETLLAITKLTEERLLSLLLDAREQNLLVEHSDGRYEFTRTALRELLLAEIERTERVAGHGQIAAYLHREYWRDEFPEPAISERLAYHYFEAGNPEAGIRFNQMAGEQAERLYHYDQAGVCYERAFSLAALQDSKSNMVRFLLKQGYVYERQNRWQKAAECFQQADDLNDNHSDLEQTLPILIARGAISWRMGQQEQAREFFTAGIEHCDAEVMPLLHSDLTRGLGNVYLARGDARQAIEWWEISMESARQGADSRRVGKALGNLAIAYKNLDDLERAIDCNRQLLTISAEMDEPLLRAAALGNLAVVYLRQGETDRALRAGQEQLGIAERIGDKLLMSRVLNTLANIYRQQHQYDEARIYCRRQHHIAAELDDRSGLAQAEGNLGIIDYLCGHNDEALFHFEKQFKLASEINSPHLTVNALNNFVMIYEDQAQWDKALTYAQRKLVQVQSFNNPTAVIESLQQITHLYLHKSDPAMARVFIDRALSIHQTHLGKPELFIRLRIDKALVLAEENEPAEALNLLAQTEDLARDIQDSTLMIKTCLEQARILTKTGQHRKAVERLESFSAGITMDLKLQAEFYFELWQLTHRSDFRDSAVTAYHELLKQSNRPAYRDRLAQLQQQDILMNIPTASPLTANSSAKIIQSLVGFLDPERAFDELLTFLTEDRRVDGCQIIILNEDTDELEVRAVTPGFHKEDLDFSQGLLREVMANRKSVFVSNAVEFPELRENPSIMGKPFLSIIAVPLLVDDRVFGALYLTRQKVLQQPFVQDDVKIVQFIADILTPVLVRHEETRRNRIQADIKNLGLFVGDSPAMQKVYRDIERSARVDSNVYIRGESGTGKELVAQAIHRLGHRQSQPFIAVNCAAIPVSLAESELFGHEKGAFSGATATKAGKFELAHGGTLFLDEIGELSPPMQAKLLRVLEDNQVWRIGGLKPLTVNVRIIVATNKNLKEETQTGNFREDLYFRLNVRQILLPPLRDRTIDIPQLANHFVDQFARQYGRHIPGFTKTALQVLGEYNWPGNIRELRNLIEQVVGDHDESTPITEYDLFPDRHHYPKVQSSPAPEWTGQGLKEMMTQFEKQAVTQALQRNNWVKFHTAMELGIDRKRLDRIIKRQGIIKQKKL